MSNHLTLSLLSKGILNNSRITNGFISYEFLTTSVVPIRRKTGSGGYDTFKKDWEKSKDNDIDCINITLNWLDRPKNYEDKKIYVEFIKKTIITELLINPEIKINVNLID